MMSWFRVRPTAVIMFFTRNVCIDGSKFSRSVPVVATSCSRRLQRSIEKQQDQRFPCWQKTCPCPYLHLHGPPTPHPNFHLMPGISAFFYFDWMDILGVMNSLDAEVVKRTPTTTTSTNARPHTLKLHKLNYTKRMTKNNTIRSYRSYRNQSEC